MNTVKVLASLPIVLVICFGLACSEPTDAEVRSERSAMFDRLVTVSGAISAGGLVQSAECRERFQQYYEEHAHLPIGVDVNNRRMSNKEKVKVYKAVHKAIDRFLASGCLR